jgi:hypothetical protein
LPKGVVTRALQLGLLGSLLARSLIAPGLMPASGGSGPTLVLCHSGLAPLAIERLFGSGDTSSESAPGHPQHHDHQHHPVADDRDAGAAPSASLTNEQLCPLGDALSAVYTLPKPFDWNHRPPLKGPGFAPRSSDDTAIQSIGFLARAPPRDL